MHAIRYPTFYCFELVWCPSCGEIIETARVPGETAP